MKNGPFNSHWLRSPIQHRDPNKSNLGCFQTFWKRRKEMITMLSTKDGMQEQFISPKDTLSLPASLLSSVLPSPFSFSEINMGYKSQRISAQPVVMQTNKNIQTTTYFTSNMQWEFFGSPESKSRRNSHSWFAHSLLCARCSLSCLWPQDLQISTRKSKFHFSTISPLQTEPI